MIGSPAACSAPITRARSSAASASATLLVDRGLLRLQLPEQRVEGLLLRLEVVLLVAQLGLGRRQRRAGVLELLGVGVVAASTPRRRAPCAGRPRATLPERMSATPVPSPPAWYSATGAVAQVLRAACRAARRAWRAAGRARRCGSGRRRSWPRPRCAARWCLEPGRGVVGGGLRGLEVGPGLDHRRDRSRSGSAGRAAGAVVPVTTQPAPRALPRARARTIAAPAVRLRAGRSGSKHSDNTGHSGDDSPFGLRPVRSGRGGRWPSPGPGPTARPTLAGAVGLRLPDRSCRAGGPGASPGAFGAAAGGASARRRAASGAERGVGGPEAWPSRRPRRPWGSSSVRRASHTMTTAAASRITIGQRRAEPEEEGRQREHRGDHEVADPVEPAADPGPRREGAVGHQGEHQERARRGDDHRGVLARPGALRTGGAPPRSISASWWAQKGMRPPGSIVIARHRDRPNGARSRPVGARR